MRAGGETFHSSKQTSEFVSENEHTERAQYLHLGSQETPTVHEDPSQEGKADFLAVPSHLSWTHFTHLLLPALALGKGWPHC